MMRISTKGRYALRIMLDLATQQTDQASVSLRGISERQQITKKYMEGIMAILLKKGLLVSTRGKMGGYRLARAPQDYTVYEIITAAEGSIAPVQCLSEDENTCPLQHSCATLPIWQGLNDVVRDYLINVTLADLIDQGKESRPCASI